MLWVLSLPYKKIGKRGEGVMNLKIRIKNIKNINNCELVLPIEKGIYGLVGANGCGKSTVLSCIAQSIFSSSFNNLSEFDYGEDSLVEFNYGEQYTKWENSNNSWNTNCKKEQRIHFNGMYEGSLFYGTRFNDSLIVDDLVKNLTISLDDIVDADEYIKDEMSFILHGDFKHYKTLKRIRNKRTS